MEENEVDNQERQALNPGGDSFPDLLNGDIDIIEYLNSGPGSVGASTENICDEDIKLITATPTLRMDINSLLLSGNMAPGQQQQQQQHHPQMMEQQLLLGHPQQQQQAQQQQQHHVMQNVLHGRMGGVQQGNGGAIYGQQQQQHGGYHQVHPQQLQHHSSTSSSRTSQDHGSVRLPDSPPETDSGAGSAGSPSGSETGPYSPEFQQFQRQQHQHLQNAHHAAALAAAAAAAAAAASANGGGQHAPPQQGSVIHAPVGPGQMVQQQQQQPQGVILNVPGLDHLTQAVVNDYLPVQNGARGLNGHPNGNGVDYFAGMAAVASGQGGANVQASSVVVPPTPTPNPNGAQQGSPHGSGSSSYTPYVLHSLHSSPYAGSDAHLQQQQQRKRPRADSTAQFVKPEPTSPTTHASEESLFYDENMAGHQAIRFGEFQKEQWHSLCNSNGRELQSLGFAVVADKGFNFSQFDTSFVNQKKNHFQISVHIEVRDPLAPKFVKVPGDGGGLKPISQFQLDFYGVKSEMLSSLVQIKQSQTDRKPIGYEPITLELPANRVTKITVARLHFSETTMNNQRKNGRPNPDQKYFYLVASLNAVVQGNEKYTIVAYNSERVIVRASNPGQFDNGDSEVHWQKGQTSNSIFHPGPVGVGTDKPTSALSVTGDISCTGTVYHPSDAKLKQNIQELNCAEALSKLSQIRVVQYEIRPEIADEWGLKDEERHRIGVIAQELERIMPEAVKDQGPYLTVDDNRIFYESAAAVKELCRLTGNLEYKVEEVEKISKKLSKLSHLRRLDSMRSTCSTGTCERPPDSYVSCSSINTNSPSMPRKDVLNEKKENGVGGNRSKHNRHHHHHYHHHVCRRFSWADRGVCDSKVIQTTIIVLVAIMAFCLLAMATLYILDWHKRNNGSTGSPNAVQLVDPYADGRTTSMVTPSGSTRKAIGEIMRVVGTTVKPPLNPCLNLPCMEFCCPNANSYYVMMDAGHDGKNPDDKRVPTIVLFSKIMNSPPLGMDFRDKIHDELSKSKSSSLDAHGPPEMIGESPMKNKENPHLDELPKLNILGLNKTIDGSYCMGDGCRRPKLGNFTYYIPVSKYMPHIPLQVKFEIDEKQTLQYCTKRTGDHCTGVSGRTLDNTGRPLTPDMDVEQRRSDTWELPVGIYQDSTYQFRVGSTTSLCDQPDDEAGASFVEYNLHFYRTCN